MTKTTYKVSGSTPFRGFQPGDTFEADLGPDEEQRALERGSITVEGKRTSAKTKKESSSDE